MLLEMVSLDHGIVVAQNWPSNYDTATAHTSLTQTLLKLNAGLVNIITAFLSCGRHDASLDYRSLTSLSNSSRIEAIDALGSLYNRLSRHDLGHTHHHEKRKERSESKRPSQRSNQESLKAETAGLPPGVAKVTVNTSQTHLAYVRPSNKRKGSATSTGTGSSKGSRSTSRSPSASPSTPLTPPPGYQTPPAGSPFAAQHPSPQRSPHHHYSHSPVQGIPRRQDKATPSYYSFASDSTKLGEIPMRKWTVPFDYMEMERLNQAALAQGWRPEGSGQGQAKGKSRLKRWFGKGGAQAD